MQRNLENQERTFDVVLTQYSIIFQIALECCYPLQIKEKHE